jgi:hypothetical protein
MATTVLATYTNLAGAPVTFSVRTVLFGLLDVTYKAHCKGCKATGNEGCSGNTVEFAEDEVRRWAQNHATQCRQQP